MKIEISDDKGNVLDEIIVPDEVDSTNTNDDLFAGWLNPSFCRDFRESINSSPIFSEDPKYMARYHLSCAVMDRLDTCIEKLNTYGDYPDSEEDLRTYNTVLIEILEYYILLELGFVDTNGEIKKKITERWGNVSQSLEISKISKAQHGSQS